MSTLLFCLHEPLLFNVRLFFSYGSAVKVWCKEQDTVQWQRVFDQKIQ
jgi:hypothetical protein